jgi:major membrane immunogen (membrane-anchored lipoprotein)
MKKTFSVVSTGLMLISVLTGCNKHNDNTESFNVQTQSKAAPTKPSPILMYKDGSYSAITEPDYEGYYCKVNMTVKNHIITEFKWNIYDSRGTVFDEKYEKVFEGDDYYMQQCRDDLKGAKTYGPKLIQTQALSKVDAVSAATWAWKKFSEAADAVIEEATK